jgi:hypothetical protein
MILSKEQYLATPIILEFCNYLARVIDGGEEINLGLEIHDRKVPPNYPTKLNLVKLEDAFHAYFWDRKNYHDNSTQLQFIANLFSVAKTSSTDKNSAYFSAIEACMFWGLGKGAAYNANIIWAIQRKDNLARLIETGAAIIDSANPDIEPFKADQIRMNAGYTKVYALICKNSVIYDGRVGAALGFLAKNFLKQGQINFDATPSDLSFPWGKAKSLGRNRNPSDSPYIFPALSNNGFLHVRWNIQANWIIEESFGRCSMPNWLKHPDALRRIEAALFMIGYDFGKSQSL